jgi:asparagine synthase (glutamine-hydrolysing)
MGGFLLVHKTDRADHEVLQAAALDSFARAGFSTPMVIPTDDYVLSVFPKRQTRELALEQFPNGDFVFSCGTLFYDGLVGKAAAAAFYRDYDGSPGPRDRAMGHYAVIVRKGGATEIISDSFGGYHVFCDEGMRIATSSFLALAASLDRLTINAQSAYEYVFTGVVSGNATLFDEIMVAPINSTIAVRSRKMEIVGHPFLVPQQTAEQDFEASIAQTMEILDRYFAAVAANFGDRVNCALSGGYDSRLIVALLRRHGVLPSLYVYGGADDSDVVLAHAIAQGENLSLAAVDKTEYRNWQPDEFAAIAHRNFLTVDGYSWDGIFDNGAEREQQALRVGGGMLAMNGGGGEILRNFFYLLDRRYTPREFLWSFYSRFDPRICTTLFNEEEYYHRLELKLEILLGENLASLGRPIIEWLYHNFRCRAWDGRVNTVNASFGHTALPFLERRLTEHASVIPTSWKNHGAYEAALIRRADRRLAAYPSSYGHDFSGAPPLSRRLADYGTYLRPHRLRRLSYRVQHRLRRYATHSRYLATPYVSAVLPHGAQVTSRLFRLEHVNDPRQMTRILSLEYLIQQLGGRVCDDFRSSQARTHFVAERAESAAVQRPVPTAPT